MNTPGKDGQKGWLIIFALLIARKYWWVGILLAIVIGGAAGWLICAPK